MQEQRQHLRISFPYRMGFTSLTTGKSMFGFGKNISLGGIYLINSQPLALDRTYELTFSLPGEDGRTITTRVLAVHCHKRAQGDYMVGMAFYCLKQSEEESLGRYISLVTAWEKSLRV